MYQFEIKPGLGVGPVRLSSHREDVRSALGEPEHCVDAREFYQSGLIVNYDSNDRVEFIEMAESELFRAIFRGVDLHRGQAQEALKHVGSFADYDRSDPQLGHSYVFQSLQLSLWRPTTPKDNQDPLDPEGRYFKAVGIAVDDYFKGQW